LQGQWGMNKPQLILSDTDRTSFDQPWFKQLLEQYFDIEYIEHNPTINSSSIFVSKVINKHSWAFEYKNRGHKCIIDNLWEMPAKFPVANAYYCTNSNWFWYNESLWYSALGYQDYVPNKTYSKLAFMPMNMVKPHRDQILSQIPNIDDFIYSYKEKHLPGDINKADETWQRYFNPNWYNDTYFSLVVETTTTGTGFVTEKTFKPCAYRHPFMVYGQAKTLQYIKQQGFETYENIFDETYDHISDSTQRLAQIIKNINEFKKVPYDQVTLEKIEHNHNLFFNTELVTNKIITEIIEPLVEYAH
jgi:hypothetical protein